MLHIIISTHINRFWQFCQEMLLREYAITWWFVIQPLITNVFALPGETWTRTPEIVFSVTVYPMSRKWHCFGLLYLRHSSTNFNIFVDNNVVLLSIVCKYYFSPSHFVFEIRYTAWLKIHNFRVYVFPGSAETLVMRGGITNHPLIAYSLSNISAKIN